MTTLSTTQDETIIEVRLNCPDEATASAIADRIVGERLAAAANIHALLKRQSSESALRGGIHALEEKL